MLDLIGTAALTAAVALNLNAIIAALPMSSAQKLTTVTLAGLWIGSAVADRRWRWRLLEYTPPRPRRYR
jgi:hypothetical protein